VQRTPLLLLLLLLLLLQLVVELVNTSRSLGSLNTVACSHALAAVLRQDTF
jgi:hypothetical protein